jgi:hypothetical protein
MPVGALLPISYGTPVGLTSGPILPANASRNALVFVNSSVSGAIAIIPAAANIALLQGQYPGISTPSVAVINGAGSITMQPGDKFIIDTIVCSCAWNAVSTIAGSALTILES